MGAPCGLGPVLNGRGFITGFIGVYLVPPKRGLDYFFLRIVACDWVIIFVAICSMVLDNSSMEAQYEF